MNNGKICVSVCDGATDAFIAKIKRADEVADVIELRLDCLDPEDVRVVVEGLPPTDKPYLFTLRSRGQGGKSDAKLDEKLKFWEHVFHSRRDTDLIIDIEGDDNALMAAINPGNTVRIVSYHDLDGAGGDPQQVWEMLSSRSTGPVKIAVHAEDAVDSIPVWKLLAASRSAGRPIIPISMGEAGKWTRILGPAYGAFMTYASLDRGSETAPGQLTAKDMADVYRVRQLSEETKVYGLIGDPVSRSLSPYIHNPAFASAGLNAVFIPFLVKDIGAFMRRMVRPETREVEVNFGGFAVTMPHKQSIIPYLDTIDPVAGAIGAVNTVRIEDGRLTGYNTDAAGFINPLKNRAGSQSAMRVAVIGAGGAARAVTYALKAELADVTVVARDAGKAAELADAFGTRHSDIINFRREIAERHSQPYHLIVNATPAGMTGENENESLFGEAELVGVRYVYDLVTRADETPLLREARKAGSAVIGGIEMLIAQGAEQFEIWTGRKAPIELMRSRAKARMEGIFA